MNAASGLAPSTSCPSAGSWTSTAAYETLTTSFGLFRFLAGAALTASTVRVFIFPATNPTATLTAAALRRRDDAVSAC